MNRVRVLPPYRRGIKKFHISAKQAPRVHTLSRSRIAKSSNWDRCTPMSSAGHISRSASMAANAYWSVKCANWKSYEVGVNPKGEGKVIECPVLEALDGGHCFKKFE